MNFFFISEPISFVDTPVVQSLREDRDAVIRCMVKGDPVSGQIIPFE